MKKNLKKIPAEIIVKLDTIKGFDVVVGCAAKFKADILAAGFLEHLAVILTSDSLSIPGSAIPPVTRGKYSAKNIDGEFIIRKDLPKETGYHTAETPNWGDPFHGYHTVSLPHQQYPREFNPPRELAILMNCSDARRGLPSYVIAFRVDEILDKRNKDFKIRLFENLNLLQENIGMCGVEPADVSLSSYIKSLHVSWEILPPGTREETIERIFRGRSPSPQDKKVAGERYDFFSSLKPKRLVYGSSGFRRYFGALLEDDLVVFENIQYGNAVYVLFKEWEELSKRSRIDLISGKFGADFERVIHNPGWEEKTEEIVAKRRKS